MARTHGRVPQENAVELTVTGRHLQISDEMKRYAREKAGRLPRYYDRVETADLILDHASHQFKVEVVVRCDHKHVFVAHADGPDCAGAADAAIEKIERQLHRHKERYRNRKHAGTPDETQMPEAGR